MVKNNVKNILFVTNSGRDSVFPFLFELTKHWAIEGRQVLYVSKSRIECLPPSVGGVTILQPHILKKMQFMYLPTCVDLMHQLASIRIRRFRVTGIIVENIVDYFNDKPENKSYDDHVSCICAALLFSSLICVDDTSEPVLLACGYVSQDSTIEQNIVKNFFANIWEVKISSQKKQYTTYSLTKKSETFHNEITMFTYVDHHEQQSEKDRSKSKLQLLEIMKKIVH